MRTTHALWVRRYMMKEAFRWYLITYLDFKTCFVAEMTLLIDSEGLVYDPYPKELPCLLLCIQHMARDGCMERKSLSSGEPMMHGVTVSNRQDIGASPLVFHHIYISISTPSLPPRKALLIHSNDFIGRMMPMINWPSSCFSTDFTAGDVGVEKPGFSSLEHTMRETTLYQPGVRAM